VSCILFDGPILAVFMLTSRGHSFEVDFATDFKSLVELRDKMLIFLQENRRDYMPVFDGTYVVMITCSIGR
jgi:hypothetical protein